MVNKAIYALSGDPVTNGHMNIIERAAKVFDEVIVAIGHNPDKRYMFDTDERRTMAELATHHLQNVGVKSFVGMLSDFAIENNANVIVRGVRNASDFEFEQSVHNVGLTQNNNLETMLLMCEPSKSHISSSVVKGLVKSGGDISRYVPMAVKCFMEQKATHKIVVGVTGSIACGKSTLAEQLSTRQGWTNIDLDHLAHEILSGKNLTQFERQTLNRVLEAFPDSRMTDGSADRKALAKEVFGKLNTQRRRELEDILKDAIKLKIKRKINEAEDGVVLLNSALLVEKQMMSLCNNRVIVVEASKDIQMQRLIETRGHTEEQARDRIDSQLHPDIKIREIKYAIEDDGFGGFIRINTDDLDLNDPKTESDIASEIYDFVSLHNIDKLVDNVQAD